MSASQIIHELHQILDTLFPGWSERDYFGHYGYESSDAARALVASIHRHEELQEQGY